MRFRFVLCAFAIGGGLSVGFAAPVEYDSPTFHLVVCRPFDSWSGDEKVMDGERETVSIRRSRVAYRVSADKPTVLGAGRTLLNGPTEDAITTDTVALLKSRGVEISSLGSYHWTLGAGTELSAPDFASFRQAQTAMYDALIRKQGDPNKIAGSAAARRFLGNFLAAAAVGAGVEKFGGVGGYVVTVAFADDIARLPLGVRQSFAPFDLPELNTASFSKFEVFPVKINEGGSPGQVIIAYKTEASEAIRHDALVQALASLAGSDTTPAAIDAARTADLQRRRDTWHACLAAGTCGSGSDAPAEVKQ